MRAPTELLLWKDDDALGAAAGGYAGRVANRLALEDRAIHNWYRFVLAFPPHLVRAYLDDFRLKPGDTLLDPFCGTGTTLVEGKKRGCNVVGFEANPMAHLAACVKTQWEIDRSEFLLAAKNCAERAAHEIAQAQTLRTLPAEAEALLLRNSICPRPLHKALVLADIIIQDMPSALQGAAQVCLATTLVQSASNLHFGPEVGVRGRKIDADVVGHWLMRIQAMNADLNAVQEHRPHGVATIFHHDARQINENLARHSIDAVFTSPPYPNEKDYTRTTRLESVVLGFFANKAELRTLKKQLVRSNTRGVYAEDTDEKWVAGNDRIEAICEEIESRRVKLGKTSGFERMYHRVTRLYFGGMVRQLTALQGVLKPGAMLGYVVGDQASYLQVTIRTGEILAELAIQLGYEVCRIDLFRERFATATKTCIREEVLVLRWPGVA